MPRGVKPSYVGIDFDMDKVHPISYNKPDVGLVQQILDMFKAVGKDEMQPCEVYAGLECCYPYYLRISPDRKKSWMSSVRHALTSPFFKSRPLLNEECSMKPRKGRFWSVNRTYDPNVKPQKRATPIKQNSPHSPKYRRRSYDPQQTAWPRSVTTRPRHRNSGPATYSCVNPSMGAYSQVEDMTNLSVYPQMAHFNSALQANGYPSQAPEYAATLRQRQSLGRDTNLGWGLDAVTNAPMLMQVVNAANGANRDTSKNGRAYFNQHDLQQGNMQFSMDPTAAGNSTLTRVLPDVPPTANQEQVKQHLMRQQQLMRQQYVQQRHLQQQQYQQQQLHGIQQQQLRQQQLYQQQQLHRQQQLHQQQMLQKKVQQASSHQDPQQQLAGVDPVTKAMEISNIKIKPPTSDNIYETSQATTKPSNLIPDPSKYTPQKKPQESTVQDSKPQLSSNHSQQMSTTTPKGSGAARSQQGTDDIRNMIFKSLGIANESDVPTTPIRSNPVANQIKVVPATQYQLVHYNDSNRQYETIGDVSV